MAVSDISPIYGRLLNWYYVMDGGKNVTCASYVSVGWTMENCANSFPFAGDS